MSSKSSSRSKYSHFGIGFSTSVLKDDFVLAFETDENFDIKSWLPFKGKIKLPTQMEVLKLVLFLRDEAGTKNHGVSAGGIYNSVAEIVQKYWAQAGFITKSRIEREVEKIHMEYKKLLKNKTKTTPSWTSRRSTPSWPRQLSPPWTDTAGTWSPPWFCSVCSVTRCPRTPRAGWQPGFSHWRDQRSRELIFPSFPS